MKVLITGGKVTGTAQGTKESKERLDTIYQRQEKLSKNCPNIKRSDVITSK